MNNASLTEKYEGNWSIRVFSDGGYRLHDRKDFAVKPKHVVTERARARPNKRPVITAFVTGMFLFGIGLPLFIGARPSGRGESRNDYSGRDNVRHRWISVSGRFPYSHLFMGQISCKTGKPAPRWTRVGIVLAVLP